MEEVEKCHRELNKMYKKSAILGWVALFIGLLAVASCLYIVYIKENIIIVVFFTILALFDIYCLARTVHNLIRLYEDKRVMDDLYEVVMFLDSVCSEEDSKL